MRNRRANLVGLAEELYYSGFSPNELRKIVKQIVKLSEKEEWVVEFDAAAILHKVEKIFRKKGLRDKKSLELLSYLISRMIIFNEDRSLDMLYRFLKNRIRESRN